MKSKKPRILSGIQPTGKLHIGNYLGMLRQSIELQESHDCFYFIADLHSLTLDFSPAQKREQIFEIMVDMLALGFDPKKSTLFIQSHIPQHAELGWIFNCLTPFSELKRMTQFKDKAKQNEKNINVGLFDYPVLQAADVLLYKPDAVPVGKDQEQHLELARLIARTFNKKFGRLFPEPKPIFTKHLNIMSLADPSKKMSKSHGIDKIIAIDDEPDNIASKIRKAVTTPQGEKNLYELLKVFSGQSVVKPAKNIDLKNMLAESIASHFAAYREKKKRLMRDRTAVAQAFAFGTKKAKTIAESTIKEAKELLGLI